MERGLLALAFLVPAAFGACARGPTTALDDRPGVGPSAGPDLGDAGLGPAGALSDGGIASAGALSEAGMASSLGGSPGPAQSIDAPPALPGSLDASQASSDSGAAFPLAGVLALAPEHQGLYPTPQMDLAPGRLPSPNAPAGTVYLARCEDDGAHITEWNLATRAQRRSQELPPKNGYANSRLLRTAGALHALVWSFDGDIAYVRLTDDLRVLSATRLGLVSVSGPMALASDGEFTIVIMYGTLEVGMGGATVSRDPLRDPSGTFAASFDAKGHLVATRMLEKEGKPDTPSEGTPSADLGDNAVVVSGKAYVMLRTGTRSVLRLLRLDRELHVERETLVRAPDAMIDGKRDPSMDGWEVTLFARDGHLFVETRDALSMVALSLSGRELGRIPVPADTKRCSAKDRAEQDVTLGGEHVWVSHGQIKQEWYDLAIEWSPDAPDASWIPPCPGSP